MCKCREVGTSLDKPDSTISENRKRDGEPSKRNMQSGREMYTVAQLCHVVGTEWAINGQMSKPQLCIILG